LIDKSKINIDWINQVSKQNRKADKILVEKVIRELFFFFAVGSQANIGGPVSAPIVASAFHPSLAPVGILLAVFGYAVGTFGAYFCGLLMQMVR